MSIICYVLDDSMRRFIPLQRKERLPLFGAGKIVQNVYLENILSREGKKKAIRKFPFHCPYHSEALPYLTLPYLDVAHFDAIASYRSCHHSAIYPFRLLSLDLLLASLALLCFERGEAREDKTNVSTIYEAFLVNLDWDLHLHWDWDWD